MIGWKCKPYMIPQLESSGSKAAKTRRALQGPLPCLELEPSGKCETVTDLIGPCFNATGNDSKNITHIYIYMNVTRTMFEITSNQIPPLCH